MRQKIGLNRCFAAAFVAMGEKLSCSLWALKTVGLPGEAGVQSLSWAGGWEGVIFNLLGPRQQILPV